MFNSCVECDICSTISFATIGLQMDISFSQLCENSTGRVCRTCVLRLGYLLLVYILCDSSQRIIKMVPSRTLEVLQGMLRFWKLEMCSVLFACNKQSVCLVVFIKCRSSVRSAAFIGNVFRYGEYVTKYRNKELIYLTAV
jgi:hypothetical protein